MLPHLGPRVFVKLLSITALALLGDAGGTAQGESPDAAFDTIKRAERSIGVPEPTGRGVVGTFDAATGQFDGLRSRTTKSPCKGCDPVVFVPTLRINAVRAILIFRLRNVDRSSPVTLMVNGRERKVKMATSRVGINVRRARSASWTLTDDHDRSVSDRVDIVRPKLIGAGAFTMEAVPLSTVYSPPQPEAPDRRNSASFGRGTVFATNIATSFSRANSTVSPAKTGYERTARVQAAIALAGKGLASAQDPRAQAAGAALKAISGAMGKVENSKRVVTTRARRKSVDYLYRQVVACETATRADPGVGDLIAFATNVRLVWFDDGRRTRLAVLGAQGFGCPSVGLLRRALSTIEHARTKPALCVDRAAKGRKPAPGQLRRCNEGMSAQTVRGLLALDPFASDGPSAELASERFEPATPSQFGPLDPLANLTLRYSASIGSTEVDSSTTTTILTHDATAGFLSFAGIGPSRTEHVVSTVTASSSALVRRGRTIRALLRLEGPPPGTDALNVFFDRIFGTFAAQSAPRILPAQ